MISMVQETIALATQHPDPPQITGQIFPMFIHCLNMTPDYQAMSIEAIRAISEDK